MKINLKEIVAVNTQTFEITMSVINLYSHTVKALDVYLTCEDTDKLAWILTPSLILGVSTPKFSIEINNILYDFKTGFPGISPTNPITVDKVINRELLGNYNELPIEESTNIAEYNIGIADLNIPDIPTIINFRINDKSIINTEQFPFGGNLLDKNDGFGGIDAVDTENIKAIEGYGGRVPSSNLDGIYLVIQESLFTNGEEVDYGIRY